MDTTLQIEQAFEPLRQQSLKRCANQEEFDLVLRAFAFAREAHKDQKRISGDPVILHCIAVALIAVQEIGLGCKSIVSALLHHIITDTEYTPEDLVGPFGQKITDLVVGIASMGKALEKGTNPEKLEFLLKNMNDDFRVLLIKLADRLHNIRHVDELPKEKMARNMGEALYLFAPLAHQLGLYAIKTEMEDIWMRNTMPDTYSLIQNQISEQMNRRGLDVEQLFVTPIRRKLRQEGIPFTIYQRIKSPYSVWRKMDKRHVSFSEIYDLFAIRIVFFPPVSNPDLEHRQCYRIEEILDGMWGKSISSRRRDWLDSPKSTGYEALHVTYNTPKSTTIEVQIRSKRMDDIAEQGIAAHWKYKNGAQESNIEHWLYSARKALEDKDANALSFFDEFQTRSLSSDMYVYTPKGEMRLIPRDSTALDFAYNIHSEIGDRALAVKVNDKLMLLSTILRGGDQVEIITTENPQPKIEWLSFVKLAKTRTAIMDALDIRLIDYAAKGQDMLYAKLHQLDIEPQARVLHKIRNACNAYSKDDLYGRIGVGLISLDQIDEVLKQSRQQKVITFWNVKLDFTRIKEVPSYHLAECCHPMPGDPILGFSDKDGNVIIHNANCPHVKALARLHKEDGRMVPASWKKERSPFYLAHISLRGKDRIGMILDISRTVTLGMCVNMRRFNIITHDTIFEGDLEVYVRNQSDLDKLIAQLKALKGVLSVK